jgi:hypothetical protein
MNNASWEWISANSQPTQGDLVLIYVPSWGDMLYTGYYGEGVWHDADGDLLIGHNKPTYWIPLTAAIQNIPHIDK